MTQPQDILRPDVLAMTCYPVPDSTGLVKLDAMENPYQLPANLVAQLGERLADVALNRYPEPRLTALIEKIKRVMEVPAACELLLGNGSDELISMMSMACAKPDAAVVVPVPGFVMYAMSAKFAGLEFVGVLLNADFTLDVDALIAAIETHNPALVYLAYPNNPTGTLYDDADIECVIAAASNSAVVINEAYQPRSLSKTGCRALQISTT